MCHSLIFYFISGLPYRKLHVDGNAICAIDSESEVQPLREGNVSLRPSIRHSVHGWGGGGSVQGEGRVLTRGCHPVRKL